ncbi:MAG: hypothetical protein ACMV1D_11880 [Macromonas sp.]
MTKDDIITLARTADVIDFRDADSDPHVAQMVEFLQRFAALVATAERRKHQADIERWKAEAATAEKWRGLALSKEGDGRCVRRVQQEAAEKEREACAALCDDMAQEEQGKVDRDYSREDTAEELAVLIRARGQQ